MVMSLETGWTLKQGFYKITTLQVATISNATATKILVLVLDIKPKKDGCQMATEEKNVRFIFDLVCKPRK